MNERLRSRLNRIQRGALIAGVLGAVVCVAGGMINARQFFISYLFSYLFWLGIAAGSFEILMMHHLSGGRWGFLIRRPLEAATATLPLLAALFVPLLFGLGVLYEWAQPAAVAASAVLRHKHVYLNGPAFIGRMLFYFAVWIIIGSLLNRWSSQQDTTADPRPTVRARKLSGPGVLIYPVLATFACIDWVMSLEPDWYSTMFAVIILIGQVLSALTFMICLLALLRRFEPFSGIVTPADFHNLGNLVLAFVIFWTYVSFGQFLIIWSGDLPREIGWYLHRIAGSWKVVVWLLFLFHFFIPFAFLLFRSMKRRAEGLLVIAATVFLVDVIAVFWLVQPSFFKAGVHVHWLDLAALLGVGGIWIADFLFELKRRPALPQNDPRLQLVTTHAH